jgi:enamine deaminase RidA (YjgF/YER057c/UK114 family)
MSLDEIQWVTQLENYLAQIEKVSESDRLTDVVKVDSVVNRVPASDQVRLVKNLKMA